MIEIWVTKFAIFFSVLLVKIKDPHPWNQGQISKYLVSQIKFFSTLKNISRNYILWNFFFKILCQKWFLQKLVKPKKFSRKKIEKIRFVKPRSLTPPSPWAQKEGTLMLTITVQHIFLVHKQIFIILKSFFCGYLKY